MDFVIPYNAFFLSVRPLRCSLAEFTAGSPLARRPPQILLIFNWSFSFFVLVYCALARVCGHAKFRCDNSRLRQLFDRFGALTSTKRKETRLQRDKERRREGKRESGCRLCICKYPLPMRVVSGGVSRRNWNGMRRAQHETDEKHAQETHPKRKLSIVLRKVHRVPAHFVWGRCCWLVGSVTVSLFVSFVCAVFAPRLFRFDCCPGYNAIHAAASNTASSLLLVVYFQFETFAPLMAWSRVAHVCAPAKKSTRTLGICHETICFQFCNGTNVSTHSFVKAVSLSMLRLHLHSPTTHSILWRNSFASAMLRYTKKRYATYLPIAENGSILPRWQWNVRFNYKLYILFGRLPWTYD